MPIIKIEHVNPDICWGIWKIDESIEILYQEACLSEKEFSEYEKYTHPKRKKEWLGARNILNVLLDHCGYDYFGLIKDKFNKPILKNNTVHISLAHSFPYAVALIHRNDPCGIDIEKAKPALNQVAYRFLNEHELLFIDQRLESLCLAWTAKEALYKMYGEIGLSFKNNIFLEPFEPENEGEIRAGVVVNNRRNTHMLEYRQVDGFYICFSSQ
ncbi:MAG: 4'-phosphopantetheinyl transferase superfamily protein [Cyclobacteriaceae bacterium]|jgi:4'-phosphopantetheinyl transferase|nr:4'-phosphopantetheinyl transferase superfamily protein [Cyclobacteriaceae bacterium]